MKTKLLKMSGIVVVAATLLTLPSCFILAPLASGTISATQALTMSIPYESDDSFQSWVDEFSEDYRYTLRAWSRDFNQMHKSFDRYFLNYDWDDPYL